MFRQMMIAALLSGATAAPALADMIVVAASGPASLQPGDRIAEGSSLKLPDGAKITILFQSGEMKRIDGPFDGKLDAAPPVERPFSGWDAVRKFLGAGGQTSEVLGASRKTDSSLPEQPGIWLVSIDSSGERCTRKDELTFWRRDADAPLTLTLRNEAGKASDLNWPAGSHTFTVPATFPVTEGALALSAGSSLRKFGLKVLPQDLEDAYPGAVLGWLLDSGCTRQASAFISRVHAGEPLE
ncbi:hypothetical protein [Pannonibacter phragmitetus]|uniref:hypothetical protein n=1 Tax=Pannonibacter phragmitetus TaxID=121719 RepID=UPI003D2EC0E6